jgi:hypothetical protein
MILVFRPQDQNQNQNQDEKGIQSRLLVLMLTETYQPML